MTPLCINSLQCESRPTLKRMHASPPCGLADTLYFDVCGHFLCLQRAKNAPEGRTIPLSFERRERQTCPLMLRSGCGQFIFACVLFPNQLTKLQCAAPFVNGADNRGCLADRPLHLPWSTPPDWRRFLGLLHMSMLSLDDWFHTKLHDTLISEQTLVPCYILDVSEDLM